jgi:hypothetical protein
MIEQKKFHVHTNASNYAIERILVQNPSDTINNPIYYASRLMIKQNYSTIEKEVIVMIYVIKNYVIACWEITSHSL